MNKIRVILTIIVIGLWGVFCSDCFFAEPKTVSSAIPGLSDKSLVLCEYDTYKLRLSNADGTVYWSSSNKEVARVSKNGRVRAVGAGSCRIYAEYMGKTYSCRIRVKKLALTKNTITIPRGRQAQLGFNKEGIEAKWVSSDSKIATVSDEGLVQGGVFPGSCVITAYYRGQEYSCLVTLKDITVGVLKKYYRANKKNKGKILLAGSSSMDFWLSAVQDFYPDEVINVGYGGTTVVQWLDWYEELIVRYNPSCVVLYVGSNDLVITDGRTNAANTILLLKRIRRKLKKIPIYYISVIPCWRRKEIWSGIAASNSLIREFCNTTSRITYIDVASAFLTQEGLPNKELFLSDELHPSSKGYLIWKRLVAKRIKKDLKKASKKG